LKLKLK